MADDRPYQANSTASVRPAAGAPQVTRKVLPPVSAAERERIVQTIAIIKEKSPELLAFIQGMYEHGLIDGWRAVTLTKENDVIPE